MSSLLKDSTITLFARSLAFVLAMGNSVIVSRVLGPSLKGSYSLVILITSVASLLVMFGLGSSNVYYGARNPDELPTLAGNSLVAGIILGGIGILCVELVTFVPIFQNYLYDNNLKVVSIRLLILILPLIQLNSYMQEIVRAAGNIIAYNSIIIWNIFTSLVGNTIFLLFLNQGFDGVIKAWVISWGFVCLLSVCLALKATGWKVNFDLRKLLRNFKFGIRLYPGNIAQFLNYRLDIFLVGLFLTPAEVGWYTTSTALAEKLWEIPHAVRTVLLYQVAAARDKTTIDNSTSRLSRIIFVLIGGMCLTLALLGYPLIDLLYGEAYLPAAAALIFLMPGVWVLSIGKLLAVHLSGLGKPEVGTIGAIISLTATLILDSLLIPRLGILGASIASSISYVLSSIVIAIFFLNATGLRLRDIILLRKSDVQYIYQAFMNAWRRRFSSSTSLSES